MIYTIYQLMRADFLERVRRYSFLVMLGATIFIGLRLPAARRRRLRNTQPGRVPRHVLISLGWQRALLTSALLVFPAFYLVKNTIERDKRSGVGQIIATTPLSRLAYMIGKWLSNLAVLAMLVGVIAVAALGMQLLRDEDWRIDLVALLLPFALISLPALAFVAGLALLFESSRWLRGSVGNIVYFFLWLVILSVPAIDKMAELFDLSG